MLQINDTDTDIDDIDTAQIPFINTLWICKDCYEIVLKASAVLPVVVFGIFGNVMVIYILWKNLKLRTATNLLIGNMAVADLLSLLIHPWVMLTYDLFQNYQLGAIGCKGEAPVECSVLLASVVSMSAITYDRLTAIVLPRETRISKKGAKTLIAILWILGLVLSIPFVFNRTYRERQWLDFLEKYCTENLVVINIYWYVIVTVMVWLPMIIQFICYIAIFVKLDKYEKITLKTMNKQHISYKKKAAITMFIVTIVFMICRLPFTALIMYRHQLIKDKKINATSDVKFQGWKIAGEVVVFSIGYVHYRFLFEEKHELVREIMCNSDFDRPFDGLTEVLHWLIMLMSNIQGESRPTGWRFIAKRIKVEYFLVGLIMTTCWQHCSARRTDRLLYALLPLVTNILSNSVVRMQLYTFPPKY